MKTAIINGKVITPFRMIEGATVLIENGKILDIVKGECCTKDCEIIDAAGKYVAPGFIDIHTHGAAGHDYMDISVEAFLEPAKLHAKYGTTLLLPTISTAGSQEKMKMLFDCFEKARSNNPDGAFLYGIHFEGPYFAYSQCGAMDTGNMRNPNPAEYMEILDMNNHIARWSLAPELPGAMEMGRELRKRGIVAAICHTDGLYEDCVEALENGYSLMTHLYSGMSTVRRINAYRFAGVLEAGYAIDEYDVEMIADGCHLPADLLRMIVKIKGCDKVALITDSVRGTGMPEGPVNIGSKDKERPGIIEDGVAKLPDRSAFAGSVATFDRLVRNMVNMAGCNIVDAVRMGTLTPARILGISDHKGILAPEKDADIVIFGENIDVCKTIIGGKVVFAK